MLCPHEDETLCRMSCKLRLTIIYHILCRLDQLCSIASEPPSYIAESPWHVQRKSTSQRGSKYDRLHSPPVKESRRELRIDVELAAQFQARKLQGRRKSPQPRTPSLGKRKRRPQTAQSTPSKTFVEDATDTILNSAVLVKPPTKSLSRCLSVCYSVCVTQHLSHCAILEGHDATTVSNHTMIRR